MTVTHEHDPRIDGRELQPSSEPGSDERLDSDARELIDQAKPEPDDDRDDEPERRSRQG